MILESARIQIVEYGKKMSSTGLVKGTGGNISIYDPAMGYMAISPSGIGYFETEPEDVVVMDLDGHVIEGNKKPSSEYELHTVVYRKRSDARAVVHTHSIYCTTLACLNQPLKAVHYVIAGAGVPEIPVAPYATFGTPELAENVRRSLGDSKAVLLQNHGLVASGVSIEKAYSLAVNMEYVAEIQYRAMCVGTPCILSDAQVNEVMERFREYGQPKKADETADATGY